MVTNQIVAAFFTEHKRVYDDGKYIDKQNPSFGNVVNTMKTLDEVFSDTPFYQFHHAKIENFIRNADRYYRLHIRSNLRTGSHVSKTQLRAI